MTGSPRYEVLGRVATTRSGAVWKARDIGLDRVVALKEISAANRDELYREAAVIASIASEHVVAVYGVEDDATSAFLVEEWVDGATVAAVLRHSGRLPVAQALGVMRGALLGLAAAHTAGLVHGDVSLSNILVDADGTARLIDFGSVAEVGAVARPATGAFAAPEVTAGLPATTAADVFAAAAVLATLLHGRVEATPSTDGVAGPVREVLDVALAQVPTERYPHAAAFLAALEDAASRAYGTGWWTQAGIGAAAAASFAALLPLGTAVAGSGVVVGSGAVAGSGAGGTSGTATSASAVGAPHLGASPGAGMAANAGRAFGCATWHSRRVLIGGGAAAVVAAAVIAFAATRSDNPTAPLAAGTSGSRVTTEVAAPSTVASSAPPLRSSPTQVPQVTLPVSRTSARVRLGSACNGCKVTVRTAAYTLNNGASTSHVDNDGSYNLVTAAADGQAVFDLSGQLRPGSIHVAKGTVLTQQSAQNLYYSVILVIQDQAGEYQQLTIAASGEPATTECTLTIDTATTSDVVGSLSCPNVATKDGRYGYAVDVAFEFTRGAVPVATQSSRWVRLHTRIGSDRRTKLSGGSAVLNLRDREGGARHAMDATSQQEPDDPTL